MSDMTPSDSTRRWLDNIVVGLNLCPFAAPVLAKNRLYIAECDAEQEDDQIAAVLGQLDKLQSADVSEIESSLLVFTQGLRDFDQYWAFVGLAEDLLLQVGLEGVIQIASFHPNYRFEGVPEEDVSHYTNRSPYPTLHFIREEQLSMALQHYPNPETIPVKNIKRLQELGKYELIKLLSQQ